MNYSQFLLGLVLCVSLGVSAQEPSEARYVPNTSPNNSLENPASYADKDAYKAAKSKGALVYGRDYIFEGVSAADATEQLINTVDPYCYLNYFHPFEKVYIELEEHNLKMILFPFKVTRLKENAPNQNE